MKKKVLNHATYAYQKYIEYCPSGANRDLTLQRLKALKAPFKAPKGAIDENMNRTYRDNTMIFCEYEPGFELFIIQTGKLK